MLDAFSTRAKQIVFAARFNAGGRGAHRIEVDDLLVVLVLQDQGMLEQNLLSKLSGGHGPLLPQAPARDPYFSQEVAHRLLAKIDGLLPQSQPVPLSTEIPTSPALARVFDSARRFQDLFHHGHTEPLHLLAATLSEDSSEGVRLLQELGITQANVLENLRGAVEN